jgi:hypothetical protein
MLDEALEECEFVINTGSSDESFGKNSDDEESYVPFQTAEIDEPSTSQIHDLGVTPLLTDEDIFVEIFMDYL